ncbi:HAMP domain-containing protein [Micromonospora sp. ALFpr18c]|uniref:sensor histidine kinase n=1 Tax=Micromonospora sp. ALFpr18c TaxID=1458665 RepID=UPI00124AE87D|nr:ATP-binding protein [Micromonospora sp. ALFpr18c]KAB1946834.1 HAMP domain-containing protein [Micromonospora sp. ALFpr18c]
MLSGLRVAQRLSLLSLLSVAVALCATIPLVARGIDQARSATVVANSAEDARSVSRVIRDLQRERLLVVGRLGGAPVSHDALLVQMQQVDDSWESAARALPSTSAAELRMALGHPEHLRELRARVLGDARTAAQFAHSYDELIRELLDGLRLAGSAGVDAPGLRQMASVDALLRLNEVTSQSLTAVLLEPVDPNAAQQLAVTAESAAVIYRETFRQEGDAHHEALIAAADAGPTSGRARAAVAAVTSRRGPARTLPISRLMSMMEGALATRQEVQDEITRDITQRAVNAAVAGRRAASLETGVLVALLAAICLFAAAINRSVARPLKRMARAANAVADLATREMNRINELEFDDEEFQPKFAAVMLRSADEIGELASAINRVQATAALLLQQQALNRRNVSVMFGNIANRTRSLVERQVARIDQLERDESNEERLAQLYQLDHLTSRLRRGTESLLAIAGRRDEEQLRAHAPTPLIDVIRSAIGEIERYQNVHVNSVANTTVAAGVVADLTLILAEVLENATSFSPPSAPVDVSASLGSDCLIRVVDSGIGMKPDRIVEENRRLVSAGRPDVAPTNMLGLIVVGRLARRHGMTVRLLPSPVAGVTVEITVPRHLLLLMGVDQPAVRPQGWTQPMPARPKVGRAAAKAGTGSASAVGLAPSSPPLTGALGKNVFNWWSGRLDGAQEIPHHHDPLPTVPRGNQPDATSPRTAAESVATETRAGLRRRRPGLSQTSLGWDDPGPLPYPPRRPDVERAELDEMVRAEAQAEGAVGSAARRPGRDAQPSAGPAPGVGALPPRVAPSPTARGTAQLSASGLERRRPGEHLDVQLAEELAARARYRAAPPPAGGASTLRDPEAERAALDDFHEGLARAAALHNDRSR